MSYSKVIEVPESQDSVVLTADDLNVLIIVDKRPSDLYLTFPNLMGDNRAHPGNVIGIINQSGRLIETDIPAPGNPAISLKVGVAQECRFILTNLAPKTSWYIARGV
ncbi:MAG: hypothetical protein QM537_04510 [Candidatus Symbiobacter sp.]|nr:hypothetical protein [Candidatus Symbiobacter sp.]